MTDDEYQFLTRRIEKLLDIDLSAYKPAQMRRRVGAFIDRSGADSVPKFCRLLDADAELRTDLRNLITINVSEFFRDAAQFAQAQQTILPALLERRSPLKIWSAGCSHGEEPYSLAILLAELGAASPGAILATDIDRAVLAQARAGGPYPNAALRNIPRRLREAYFTRTGDTFHVLPAIRAQARFREFNLLTGRFGSDYDLVACRNVMIYFSDPAKNDLIRRFCAALRPDGVLFIGATEAILDPRKYGLERAQGNFYRRTTAAMLGHRAA